jgi:hypothetical protein
LPVNIEEKALEIPDSFGVHQDIFFEEKGLIWEI